MCILWNIHIIFACYMQWNQLMLCFLLLRVLFLSVELVPVLVPVRRRVRPPTLPALDPVLAPVPPPASATRRSNTLSGTTPADELTNPFLCAISKHGLLTLSSSTHASPAGTDRLAPPLCMLCMFGPPIWNDAVHPAPLSLHLAPPAHTWKDGDLSDLVVVLVME